MPVLQVVIDALKAKAGARQFKGAADSVKRGGDQIHRSVTRADKSIDQLGRTASGTRRMLGGLFAGVSAAVIVRDMTKVIRGYEETIAILQGVSGIVDSTDVRLAALQDTARTLGATTRFSAQEAAEGLLFLARAGFEVDEQVAALPSTLHLALAGVLELGRAADIASNTLSQFGMAAVETERVVDALVITSNRTNTNVEQLAEAMKMAGPIAGALGYTIEDTAAAIGVLGDFGIQASLAGTNLRGTMSALMERSDKLEAALKKLGLRFEDVNPEEHDLLTIYQRFAESGLRASNAVEIFGRRNAAAALILSKQTKKLEELRGEFIANTGEAERMAKIQEDTLTGSFKSLRSSIEEAYLAIGEGGFGGGLRALIDIMTNTVRVIVGMDDKVTKFSTTARVLATTLEVLTKALITLLALKIAVWIYGIVTALESLRFTLFAIQYFVVTNPLGAVVTGLAAVVGMAWSYKSIIRSSASATNEYAEELNKLNEVLGRTKNLQTRLNRAIAIEDLREQANVIDEQVRQLEDLSIAWRQANRMFVPAEQLYDVGLTTSLAEQRKMLAELEDQLGDANKAWLAFRNSQQTSINRNTSFIVSQIELDDALKMVENRIIELKEQSKALRREAEKTSKVTTEVAGDNSKYAKAVALARDELSRMIEELQLENQALQMGEQDREMFIQAHKALGLVMAAEVENAGELYTRILQLIDANRRLTEGEEKRLEVERELGRSRAAFEEWISDLRTEKSLIGASTEDRRAVTALRRAEAMAAQDATGSLDHYVDQVIEEVESINRLTIAHEALKKEKEAAKEKEEERARSLENINKTLDEQIALTGIEIEYILAENSAREGAITAYRIQQTLQEAGIQLTEKELELLQRKLELLVNMKQREEDLRELDIVANQMGREFADVLEGMIWEAKSFEDAMKHMLMSISRMVFQQMVTKPITDMASSFLSSILTAGMAAGAGAGAASAQGNIFSNGRLVPFARGGVVSSPTVFPMANGGVGLLGEAGPEAIMPLKRDTKGNLGIVGGEKSEIHIHVHGATNPNEWRRGQRKIFGDIDKQLMAARRGS